MADYIGQNIYIKPTYLVSLPEYTGCRGIRSLRQRETEKFLKKNSTNGIVSSKSSRKIKNAVNWLCCSAKDKALYSKKHKKFFYFKINFITLTIPYNGKANVPEKVAKKTLHAFLSYSRKYFYLRNYVWKMEQTKAGQLHIHLTTDTYIHYAKLRSAWNRILDRNSLLDEYKAVQGHANPNSTDVHAVRKVKDIAAYISKYMAKSEITLKDYKGRIWGCNHEISDANSCSDFIDRMSSDVSVKFLTSNKVQYKPILAPPDNFNVQKEIGAIYFMDESIWQKLQLSSIRAAYDKHRFYIRNNLESLPREYWEAVIDEYFDSYETNKTAAKTIAQVQVQDDIVNSLLRHREQRTAPTATNQCSISF